VRGRDEIASLAESFNRMRRSLANAMKLLES
jgi:HAMP domain-containing protein